MQDIPSAPILSIIRYYSARFFLPVMLIHSNAIMRAVYAQGERDAPSGRAERLQGLLHREPQGPSWALHQ
jgi:hypothetical protein